MAALTSPQQQLKDTKMGENNPQHLVNLANCLGLPLVRAENVVTIDDPCVRFVCIQSRVVLVVQKTTFQFCEFEEREGKLCRCVCVGCRLTKPVLPATNGNRESVNNTLVNHNITFKYVSVSYTG